MNTRPRRAAAKRQNYAATTQNSSQEPSENEASEETVIKPKKRQRRSRSDDTDVSSRKKSTDPEEEELAISEVLSEIRDEKFDENENSDAPDKEVNIADSDDDTGADPEGDSDDISDPESDDDSDSELPALPENVPENMKLCKTLPPKVLLQKIAQLRHFYTNFEQSNFEEKEKYLDFCRWLSSKPVRKWLFEHEDALITTQILKIIADMFRIYTPYSPFDTTNSELEYSLNMSQHVIEKSRQLTDENRDKIESFDKIHESIFSFIVEQMRELSGKHFMRVKTALKTLAATNAMRLALDLPRKVSLDLFEKLFKRAYDNVRNSSDEQLLNALLSVISLNNFPKFYTKIIGNARILDLVFLHVLEKCKKFNPKAYQFTAGFLNTAENSRELDFAKCVMPYFKNMLLVQENNVLIPVNASTSTKRRESFSNPPSRLSEKVFQILGETFILAPKILTALFPVIQTHFLVHDDDLIREKSTELLATCFEAEPPGYNLILDAPDLWKAYLSRLNDKLASVRLIVVRSLGPILSKTTTVSTIIRQILDGLNPRTQDLDENVRLACVCAIHETVQNRPRIFTVNLSNKTTFTGIHPFVQIITKQMLDKKTRLRTYSMYIAGAVYEALFRNKNNNPECEHWAIYLSERLLRNYRRPTVTVDDKACIERVLRKYLIGDYKITEHERLDRLLMLYQNSSPPVRQIIMFLINAHGDYQKRFQQLFSMLEGSDENDLKMNNSEGVISSDKENVDSSVNSNVSNSVGKLNTISDGFHNLSIQAQDKIVAKLINELGRRTPPTALISNELRYGTNHCDFLTILSVAQQSKDQKIEESLITVWRKLADGSIEDTDRRRIVLDLVNPNMEIDKSQRSVEKIQKLLDYDPNKSGNLSKSRLGTGGNNAISRPTLRQFDACLEHTRPWLVDVKFMQLLIRKYREELEEHNADFDSQNTEGSQKTESGCDLEKTQNSDTNLPQNTQDTIDTSLNLEEKLPIKKALTEILQQIFKSYSIQKIENYSKQFIYPIVQIFSEQTIYTEPFINLMRVIINSSPFKNPGMAGSRALLSCSLQNLIDECNSHKHITPTIIKQVCECWYSLASDADEIVETFYKVVDHKGRWSLSELAIIGVFSKSLPNECERKAWKVWEKLKPVLRFETEVESTNLELENLKPETNSGKTKNSENTENTENSENTETSDSSTPRRSARARKSVATPVSKSQPTPKKVRKPKTLPVDTEYVRHAIKCCVRCVQSMQAPTELVADFYNELINLTQCSYKDVKIAAGTAILKMHALPRILTKEVDSIDGVPRRVQVV